MADAAFSPGRRVGPAPVQRQRLAVHPHLAADLGALFGETAENLQQLSLAIAGHAGDADDLARANVEGNAANTFDLVDIDHAQVAHLKDGFAGLRRGLVDLQQDLAADHQLGQFLGRGFGGFDGCHHLAAPHDADIVGVLHDLAQLVGDQDDGLALIPQAIENAEQVIRLGGRQHAGGFIQDQNVGLAVQRLQDLDPLLVADRKLLDRLVGIDLQFVFRGQLAQAGPRARQGWAQQRAVLGPEDDIFQHGEVPYQLEMLEYHADARADRGHGIGDLDRLAVDQNLAAIGFVEAVQDRHQRRFPGPVFADNAVDRALLNRQVDVLVGLNRAECLRNPPQLNGRRDGMGGRIRPPSFGCVVAHQSTGQVLSVM